MLGSLSKESLPLRVSLPCPNVKSGTVKTTDLYVGSETTLSWCNIRNSESVRGKQRGTLEVISRGKNF